MNIRRDRKYECRMRVSATVRGSGEVDKLKQTDSNRQTDRQIMLKIDRK